MQNSNHRGTLNGNQASPPQAGLEPVSGRQGMGRAAPHPASLGAGHELAARLRPQAPTPYPGRRATGPESCGAGPRLSYAEKLRDVRWKRRRDDLLRARNYTCCECGTPLIAGTMDLQVHHVVYIANLAPWDYPDELLVIVCNQHHQERQAVEQAIYLEVGKHLATLDVQAMLRQPIYAFFAEDATLGCLPVWMQDFLCYQEQQKPG